MKTQRLVFDINFFRDINIPNEIMFSNVDATNSVIVIASNLSDGANIAKVIIEKMWDE